MRKIACYVIITACFILAVLPGAFSQNVGIGTSTPHSSALLEVSSNNKGVVLPRMSSTQRNAIPNPVKGMLVYDTVHSNYFYHDGGRWLPLYQRNYDSAIVDYSGAASNVTNLPASTTGGNFNIGNSVNSGFIYDNGGPAGNYSANTNSSVSISKDDTTLHIKIDVEEMDAELFYDSLFIISPGYDTIGLSANETGNFIINTDVKILFKANSIQQFAGFKIRWARVKANTALQVPAPPYGWHFEIKKVAAMGGFPQQNNWHADSVGYASFSYGIGVKAKGASSVAFGKLSKATGNNGTVAIGWQTIASGDFGAVAIGDQAKATGMSGATAFGQQTTASGDNGATAMGYYSVASGSFGSIATGFFTMASGNTSTAIGNSTTASGLNSIAMGLGTKSKSFTGTVIGTYNDTTNAASSLGFNAANRLFQIGNGSTNAIRSNAMTVLQNGNIGIGELAPNVPLNFANTTGNKISLSGNGFNHYGFGIQSSLLQLYSPDASSDIGFGYGNSVLFTEKMRIKGNGNVGIGTNSPGQMLSVEAGMNIDQGEDNTGTLTNSLRFGNSNSNEAIGSNRNTGVNQWGLDFYTNSFKRISITNSGNVGIGNTTPNVPLQFANTGGNKIAFFENGSNYYGIGTQASLLQLYTPTSSDDIAFGYGNSTSFTENIRMDGSGSLAVKTDITVQNGKGIIRNNSGVQLKQVVTNALVNPSIGAGATQAQIVTWAETFGATPVAAYLGNVTGGAGGWAEVVMTITNITNTGCILYVFNPKNVTVNPSFTINIITMGAQ